jgi:hypothetical protein
MEHVPPGYLPLPVRNTAGDHIHPIGLILHVQAGDHSPFGWFNNPSSQASSNLWAGKNGQREQYVDLDVRAWAQAAGNETYASIETEGQPGEPLTDAQLDSVAVAMAFGAREFGWPLRLANAPGQPGLGTHAMGGAAWGDHPGCPGSIRTGQRAEILRRAGLILNPPEDDMPTAADVWSQPPPAITPVVKQADQGHVAAATYNKIGDVQTRLTAIAAGLSHLAVGEHQAAASVLAAAAAAVPLDEPSLAEQVAGLTDRTELLAVLKAVVDRLAGS